MWKSHWFVRPYVKLGLAFETVIPIWNKKLDNWSYALIIVRSQMIFDFELEWSIALLHCWLVSIPPLQNYTLYCSSCRSLGHSAFERTGIEFLRAGKEALTLDFNASALSPRPFISTPYPCWLFVDLSTICKDTVRGTTRRHCQCHRQPSWQSILFEKLRGKWSCPLCTLHKSD